MNPRMYKQPLEFNAYIYGNVPVLVEIAPNGHILGIAVLDKLGHTLYWLDMDDLQAARFAVQFHDQIEATLDKRGN